MSGLQFVAFTDDGKAVILQNEAGEWIEVAITGSPGDIAPIRPLPQTSADLTPREIQARIRAGASPEELARETGVSIDRIMLFAPPIIMERKHVAAKASRSVIRRANGSGALADVVNARLEPLGVDTLTLSWDSYRREDGRWTVILSYPTAEGPRVAMWLFDVRNSALVPADDEARWLIGEPLPKGAQSHPEHPTLVVPHLSVVKAQAALPEPPVASAETEPAGLFEDAGEPMVTGSSSESLAAEDVDTEPQAAEVSELSQPEPTGDEVSTDGEFERLTRPEPQEKRRSRLPSWDEILFGKTES